MTRESHHFDAALGKDLADGEEQALVDLAVIAGGDPYPDGKFDVGRVEGKGHGFGGLAFS